VPAAASRHLCTPESTCPPKPERATDLHRRDGRDATIRAAQQFFGGGLPYQAGKDRTFVLDSAATDRPVVGVEAGAVIDASGTWASPNPAGAHGLTAPGDGHELPGLTSIGAWKARWWRDMRSCVQPCSPSWCGSGVHCRMDTVQVVRFRA
jgi:hypothetical protein